MKGNNFKPKILVFACHYWAYSAADLAGSSRLQYPSSMHIIRTPCTGRLEVDTFLKAFEKGADGVLVAGWEEGSCHFQDGNLIAKRRVNYTKKLLEEVGIDPERIRMVNLGAADARRFADAMNEMAETIKKLGPAGLKKDSKARATAETT